MFAALARRHGGQLSREQTVALLASVGLGEGGEHVELLWSEMGLAPDAFITQVQLALAPLLCNLLSQSSNNGASAFCCRRTGSA